MNIISICYWRAQALELTCIFKTDLITDPGSSVIWILFLRSNGKCVRQITIPLMLAPRFVGSMHHFMLIFVYFVLYELDTPHATLRLTCWKVTSIATAFLFLCWRVLCQRQKFWSGLFSAFILLIYVLTEVLKLHNFIAEGPARLRGRHWRLIGLYLFAVRLMTLAVTHIVVFNVRIVIH